MKFNGVRTQTGTFAKKTVSKADVAVAIEEATLVPKRKGRGFGSGVDNPSNRVNWAPLERGNFTIKAVTRMRQGIAVTRQHRPAWVEAALRARRLQASI